MTPRERLKLLFFATAFALLCRLILVESFRVASASMEPNLFPGDFIFASKFDYSLRFPFSSFEIIRLGRPKPGEIVVFNFPDRPLDTYIKRVIALEGDEVELKDGVLSVNRQASFYQTIADENGSKLLLETQAQAPERSIRQGDLQKNYGPVWVPKGHFFVLGDNRSDSQDSRVWGPVPLSYIKGKARLVWFSFSPGHGTRFERIGTSLSH